MDVALKCRCGSLLGVARDVSRASGKRIVCYCDDCQAYARFLGAADRVLDANGGTEVFPVAPAKLTITQGAEHLACLRLSDSGMLRWYASCCKTPIANCMPSPRVPFAGVVHTILDFSSGAPSREEVLGPVFARVQGRYGYGTLPPDASQRAPLRVMVSTLRFLLVGFVRGAHHPSPFFDANGEPARTPYVLTLAERQAAATRAS